MYTWGPFELAKLALVRADVVAAVTKTRDDFERETGIEVFVIRGWSSFAEQAAIYADSLKEGYRASPPERSRHPLGAAVDLGIVGHVRDAETDQKDPLYAKLAGIAERNGLAVGYKFTGEKPDPYHVEAWEPLAESRRKWDVITRERLWRAAFIGFVAVAGVAFYYVKHRAR